MDIYPLACACFSVGANVVFIFNAEKKHHSGAFVKWIFLRAGVLIVIAI
jgi:hypothetical protein